MSLSSDTRQSCSSQEYFGKETSVTQLVQIEVGQFVLAIDDPYFPREGGMAEAIEALAYAHSYWGGSASDRMFVIRRVERAMPKTYAAGTARGEKRYDREAVLAASHNEADLLILRDQLLKISEAMDERIYEQVRKVAAPIEQREVKAARAELRAVVPHLFQGDA